MKIIKKGVILIKALTGRCSACGCEVECEQTEVVVKATHCPREQTTSYHTNCPTLGCGGTIHLRRKSA